MHKIHDKEFYEEDFSFERIMSGYEEYKGDDAMHTAYCSMQNVISALNRLRYMYKISKNKKYWYAMIQLLPSSYNQKRTVMLNYEVLANMYKSRKNHKLDEWHVFCNWVESLPYSELITGQSVEALEKQATQKWISVDDRLPDNKEYDWVLAQVVEDNGFMHIPIVMEYRQSKNDWFEETYGWLSDHNGAFTVTHWMPLPQPPKGE